MAEQFNINTNIVRSKRPNPLRGFNFIAIFKDLNGNKVATIGFKKITGLKITNKIFEIKYTDKKTGGVRTTKMPDDMVFPNLSFEKGAIPYTENTKLDSPDNNIFFLHKKINELFGLPKNKDFKKFDIEILLFDHHGRNKTLDSRLKSARYWTVLNAWVGDIEFGDLDSQSSNILIDKFTIICDKINFNYNTERSSIKLEQDVLDSGRSSLNIDNNDWDKNILDWAKYINNK